MSELTDQESQERSIFELSSSSISKLGRARAPKRSLISRLKALLNPAPATLSQSLLISTEELLNGYEVPDTRRRLAAVALR